MTKTSLMTGAAMALLLATAACGKKEKPAKPEATITASSCNLVTGDDADAVDWAGATETTLGTSQLYILAGSSGDVAVDCATETACLISGKGFVGIVSENDTLDYADVLEFSGDVKLAITGEDITCEASVITTKN